MAHALIVGVTMSGKTTLATLLSRQYQANQTSVLVLDPNLEPGWGQPPLCHVLDDYDEFLEVFKNSQRCAVFVDEGGETVGHGNHDIQFICTRGRHWGHKVFIMAQRATQVSPNVRNNCGELFCFAQFPSDAKALAEDFNDPNIAAWAPNLEQGQFIHKMPFQKAVIKRVF